jgi:hypothetical protein
MVPHSRQDEDNRMLASTGPPSNEKLLCTAFISFQCFAIAQTVAAVVAGSEAMLGDSAASKYLVMYIQCMSLRDEIFVADTPCIFL